MKIEPKPSWARFYVGDIIHHVWGNSGQYAILEVVGYETTNVYRTIGLKNIPLTPYLGNDYWFTTDFNDGLITLHTSVMKKIFDEELEHIIYEE